MNINLLSACFVRIMEDVLILFCTEINIDIDQAAEVDSALFWKKILNYRRKFSSYEAGCEMKFGTTICRDLEQIASGWGTILEIYILTLSCLIMIVILNRKWNQG